MDQGTNRPQLPEKIIQPSQTGDQELLLEQFAHRAEPLTKLPLTYGIAKESTMSSQATILSRTYVDSKENNTREAAHCLPVPVARLGRQKKYRNQDFGEKTLVIRISDAVAVAGPVSAVCGTPEITFCQLLIKAGVLSECAIREAMDESCERNIPLIKTIGHKFKIPRRTCLSICLLVEKLKAETMTFSEGVLATQHMCLFQSSLVEALQFVSSLAEQSIISFLQVVGLINDDDLYKLTEGQWIEPTRLAAMLVSQGIIETDVLRNATRLRYWLKTGVLDLEATTGLLITCLSESTDVEHCYCLRSGSVAA